MKSGPGSSQKKFSVLLNVLLAVLCLSILVGCSGGDDQTETNPSAEVSQAEAKAELDQLMTENELLQAELDKAVADLEAAESKFKELEDTIAAMQEAQTKETEAAPKATPTVTDITRSQLSPSELLLGEWFNQEFHENEAASWTQNFVFNADGTGTIYQTYYIPKAEIPQNDYDKPTDIDRENKILWKLVGNTLHINIDNDTNESVDFTYDSEQQKFTAGDYIFGREMPTGLEQYVERRLYAKDYEADEAQRRRKFIGSWYYDVSTFTFSDDGTGVWDIPEVGDQPAEKRKYTYSVDDNYGVDDYLCLTIDWEDSSYWMLFPTFNADGSISLKSVGQSEPVMTWTRTFDPNNCPITMQIISTGLGVFSGSIFNNLLGGD